jgi:hypothetical protein
MTGPHIHVDGLKQSEVALLKQVSDEAANKAVRQMMTVMGFDPDKPLEAQRDMAWVRSSRKRDEGIWNKIIVLLVGVGVVGMTSAFWIGFTHMISGKSPQ